MQKILQNLKLFFSSNSSFKADEWILKQQINTMLILSFFFGIGVFIFSIFRLKEGNYVVGISQLLVAIHSLYGFFKLRQNKNLYSHYALIFFLIFFIYTGIIFFFVPQNTLNILWVISAPILIFFFLDRKGGIVMFLLVFSFILYLILTEYRYNLAEFITLLAAFFMTSFVMNMYENIKEAERKRLTDYNQKLKNEVKQQTQELLRLNQNLEQRVQKEIDKRQAQEQMLFCQNRMANMGMMIDSIAHQWRQPLMHINAILMNISRITETQPNSVEYVEEKVDDIFHITEHMSQTIHDFRELFQQEKEKQLFNIEKMIEKILMLTKGSIKDIKISIRGKKNLNIKSYQNELSQVVLIILHNAIEVLHERAIINKEINIELYNNNYTIFIAIEDNAKGIEKHILPNIFSPYFTTKKEQSGTGLGLYIAKLIIEQSMKGKIDVSNTQNGAKFIISVPKSI